MAGTDDRRWKFCPVEYENPLRAITDLIRWAPDCFTASESHMLIYFAERTLAHGKPADRSSLSQITRGIYSWKQRGWLRGGSGLRKTAAIQAIHTLRSSGFLIVRRAVRGEVHYNPGRGNQPTEYEINWSKLYALFRSRESAPLVRGANKPLVRTTDKPLVRDTDKNREESSSEKKEINTEKSSPRKRSVVECGGGIETKTAAVRTEDEKIPVSPGAALVELAQLCRERGQELSAGDWRNLTVRLGRKGIGVCEFVAFSRPHLRNKKTHNPMGLLTSKIRDYYSLLTPAVRPEGAAAPPPPPVDLCTSCSQVRGKGVIREGNRFVPCECATSELRESIERANERDEQRRMGDRRT